MIPKPKTARSPEYLEFIRNHPCLTCGYPQSDPAHTEAGGMGMKGSDFSCVPLCRGCHREAHQVGHETFAERNNLDFTRVRLRLMENFIRERL